MSEPIKPLDLNLDFNDLGLGDLGEGGGEVDRSPPQGTNGPGRVDDATLRVLLDRRERPSRNLGEMLSRA